MMHVEDCDGMVIMQGRLFLTHSYACESNRKTITNCLQMSLRNACVCVCVLIPVPDHSREHGIAVLSVRLSMQGD
jgi:hypothetical protein